MLPQKKKSTGFAAAAPTSTTTANISAAYNTAPTITTTNRDNINKHVNDCLYFFVYQANFHRITTLITNGMRANLLDGKLTRFIEISNICRCVILSSICVRDCVCDMVSSRSL